jgi:hypothetical protein
MTTLKTKSIVGRWLKAGHERDVQPFGRALTFLNMTHVDLEHGFRGTPGLRLAKITAPQGNSILKIGKVAPVLN